MGRLEVLAWLKTILASHINCKNGIMSCLTMHGFTTESYSYCYSREKPEDKKEESWLLCGALSLDFFTNCANYKGGDDRQKLIFISEQKKKTQNTKKLGELSLSKPVFCPCIFHFLFLSGK